MLGQLQCEVCGRDIFGRSHKVMIEGAKLIACNECAKHGSVYHEAPKPRARATSGFRNRVRTSEPARARAKKTQKLTMEASSELVEDFCLKIRQAREELGLTHEELGKRINEKVSLLRKIETGKMIPDNRLASILEHILKVKLIVPTKKTESQQEVMTKKASIQHLTFGDLINHNRDKEKGEATRRGQS